MFDELFRNGGTEKDLMNFLLNPKMYKVLNNINKISNDFFKNNGFAVKTKCPKCGHEFSINLTNEKGEFSTKIFKCDECNSYIEFKAMTNSTDKKIIILAKVYDLFQETDLQENFNKYLLKNMPKEDINATIEYAKENGVDENEINEFLNTLKEYNIEY